ncbi:MAG: zinc ribbon domain-containing protein [Gammaproteobacteria bacterium]|nr:zinc ribbon domain-containing protein [Gammaproteobacteria bacterium]MDE0413694.1 zinc ribbon domain-containing protein [Gammaproteobacteria bacterium]MDE0454694.1 zinc ribbon domain-containing protein [Gammaproteobacteria bacterium]
MPIYEYECRECGYRLDALQKMSDPLLSDCPECERPGLKKLVSAPHFRLKGSGWYETDFKNSGRDRQEGAGKDAGNGAGKAASGKETDGGKNKADSSPGKESSASPASDAAAA